MISPDPSKVRVLVVDDQKNMRATTAMLLRSAGYATREAAGAEEALAAISAEPLDVVLTDLRMEPVDGLALLEADGAQAEPAGRGDDRVRHHRERRRGHAARRVRL